MTYTVTKLITNSYYLSGKLAQGLQTISGRQLEKGLQLLNAVIAVKSVNERLIPYFTSYSFNAVPGQEVYFIPNLIFADTFTFNYQNVRYSMYQMQRVQYQGSSRVNNIDSLMFNYNIERCKGGANLSMYFLPDSEYPCTIWGKFSLVSVVLNQDLESTMDLDFIEYLRYALAEMICQDNNVTFQPQNKQKLEEYENLFLDKSGLDLTIQIVSSFKDKTPSLWGIANLGPWMPG